MKSLIRILGLLMLMETSAMAAQTDLRTYLTGSVTMVRFAPHYPLSVFAKNENRFRTKGLIFDKEMVGLGQGVTSWFKMNLYFAHKDLWKQSRIDKKMGVLELFVKHRFAYFAFSYRNGNEWHITDRFYRNREKIELRGILPRPVAWLSFWLSEEFRIDSDQGRINMNDLWVGLRFTPKKGLDLKVFWGMENNRRKASVWSRTDIVGLGLHLSI